MHFWREVFTCIFEERYLLTFLKGDIYIRFLREIFAHLFDERYSHAFFEDRYSLTFFRRGINLHFASSQWRQGGRLGQLRTGKQRQSRESRCRIFSFKFWFVICDLSYDLWVYVLSFELWVYVLNSDLWVVTEVVSGKQRQGRESRCGFFLFSFEEIRREKNMCRRLSVEHNFSQKYTMKWKIVWESCSGQIWEKFDC